MELAGVGVWRDRGDGSSRLVPGWLAGIRRAALCAFLPGDVERGIGSRQLTASLEGVDADPTAISRGARGARECVRVTSHRGGGRRLFRAGRADGGWVRAAR